MKNCRGEISGRPSGFAGFVVVVLGGQLFMNLAVEIAGSVLGEHASNAHHPRGYTHRRRLTLAPFFTPETTETPIKAKRSEQIESSLCAEGSFHRASFPNCKIIPRRHPSLPLACGDRIDWPTDIWTIVPSTTDRTMS